MIHNAEVKSRKRNLNRRSSCAETVLERVSELETLAKESLSLLKLVGAQNFSGDDAMRLVGMVDTWRNDLIQNHHRCSASCTVSVYRQIQIIPRKLQVDHLILHSTYAC